MDSTLRLRDSGDGNLTADETLTSVRVGPMNPQGGPLYLHVYVPQESESDTLDVELEFCDEESNTTEVYRLVKRVGAGENAIPFWTDEEYLQVKLDVTGTSVNFGAVEVWISTGPLS